MLLWTLLAVAHAADPVPDVVARLGTFAFSDGTSVYTLTADHGFELEPIGMSGLTIDGVWSVDEQGLVVSGKWGWVNGLSRDDDFRELRMTVSYAGEPSKKVGFRETEVFPVELTLGAEKPIDRATFESRRTAPPK